MTLFTERFQIISILVIIFYLSSAVAEKPKKLELPGTTEDHATCMKLQSYLSDRLTAFSRLNSIPLSSFNVSTSITWAVHGRTGRRYYCQAAISSPIKSFKLSEISLKPRTGSNNGSRCQTDVYELFKQPDIVWAYQTENLGFSWKSHCQAKGIVISVK